MLTDAEKKWLKARRGNRCKGGYFAFTSDSIMDFVRYNRVLTPDYRDAAEFEARVAATIARGEFYRPCHSVDVEKCAYPVEGNCCVCHIKYARLAVEAEMEMEKNHEKQSA